MKKTKIKVKPKALKILKIIGVILCILLGIFLFYLKQINDLTKLGYSKKASNNILFSFKKDYVMSIGENKTVNRAFESEDYIEDNLDNYRRVKYVNHKDLISNINKALEIGYKYNDINIIFSHGDNDSVKRFLKREKVKYLEEFFSIDYAKLDNYDRYLNYADETGEDEDVTVLLVNLDLDKEDYTDAVKVDKFSIDMLVNKHRYLDEKYEPNDLMEIPIEYAAEAGMQSSRIAFNAFREMSNAASKEGYGIIINSAYRSYQDQIDLSEYYKKWYGQSYVDKYVAKPGYSEHQTGLAYDIGSKTVNVFANSKEYQWMKDNAYKYGFIERFTKRYENITGFRMETWHYRYVGKDIAKYIHDNNIPFEEYWAIYLDK
ncbi:MAG: M15 family metallopeptidase [Bacilli bacterium]|nr:M15 family metallopeptidase [Bacilli bacterium]